MPYIEKSRREDLYCGGSPQTVGELNYAITKLVTDFLDATVSAHPRYADYNAVIGVLECAKLELYRRVIASYEDRKCAENGDVY